MVQIKTTLKNVIKKILYSEALLDKFPISNTIKYFIFQKILRINGEVPWPVHFTSIVGPVKNIIVKDVDINGKYLQPWVGMSPGNYIQAINKIYFGKQCFIGPGVKIISADHDLYDYDKHKESKPIVIGDYCWIGANSIILKGVELGPHTIVAAGSVVTKSFINGFCVIGGDVAKVIKYLDKNKVVEYKHPIEYIGHKRKDELTNKDTYYIGEK